MTKKIFRWFTAPAFADEVHRPPAEKASITTEHGGNWPRSRVLLEFTCVNKKGKLAKMPYTLEQSYEGVIAFGRVGTGKTTGTGEHISRAMLRAGYGGLVLCAKVSEADDWQARAVSEGRGEDVRRVTLDGPHTLNFLEYENQHGANAESLVKFFDVLAEVMLEGDEQKKDVWDQSGKELLKNVMDLIRLAGEPLTVAAILDIFADEDAAAARFAKARKRDLEQRNAADLAAIEQYYKGEVKARSDKMRTSVTMGISSTLGPFKRGAMRDLFTTTTTLDPLETREGKIIIVDIAVKQHHAQATLAAAIWKLSFQRAVERKRTDDSTRPVFLFADECQFFCAKTDADFQTTSRQAKCATIYLTQNFPTLANKYGGGPRGEATAKGILGNLVTKIFHANDCPVTNQLACETLGKALISRTSRNANANFGADEAGGSGGGGTTTNLVSDYQVQPVIFQTLATGGHTYGDKVTAVFFRGGNLCPNGRRYCVIRYRAIYQ